MFNSKLVNHITKIGTEALRRTEKDIASVMACFHSESGVTYKEIQNAFVNWGAENVKDFVKAKGEMPTYETMHRFQIEQAFGGILAQYGKDD